jgi:hypothetical protein
MLIRVVVEADVRLLFSGEISWRLPKGKSQIISLPKIFTALTIRLVCAGKYREYEAKKIEFLNISDKQSHLTKGYLGSLFRIRRCEYHQGLGLLCHTKLHSWYYTTLNTLNCTWLPKLPTLEAVCLYYYFLQQFRTILYGYYLVKASNLLLSPLLSCRPQLYQRYSV